MRILHILIDLRKLHAFVEVSASGSLARAAGTLGTAQSALSRQISALERALGGRLFHRTGRGIALTELGERMLPRARALVADALAFQAAATQQRDSPTGEVSLGVVPVASRGLVAALAARLHESYPGIRLRALEGYSGQVEEWLAAGRVDIALFNRYRRGRVANAEPLMRAETHLVVRADHALAREREIALRGLAGVPLAMPVRPNSLTNLLAGLAASQHFELHIALEAGSTPLIREAIELSGLGTISPPRVFAREIESGAFRSVRIVRPAIAQTTWMALGSHRPVSAAARVVARIITDLAGGLKSGTYAGVT